MSSRNRLLSGAERNHGRSSTSSSRPQQNRGPSRLPEYESLSCPLDANSRAALAQLSTNQDTRKYEEHLKQSITLLTNSVRDINDKYVKRKETLKILQEKRGGDGEKGDRERAEEKAVLMLKGEVPQLTDECDLAVRDVIDLKIELEDGRHALQETVRKVEFESANAARREEAQGDDEDDDEMTDANLPDVKGPLQILKGAKARSADDYSSRTLYERYGLNNDYVGFKGMWHDAVHGSDGKPLPDASKWFTQNGSDADEDEDLVVAEEHVSIHCPLSMVVMQDPYTSRKCKHTFEKTAIVEFLRSQPERKAQCPQTGCDKEVSIKDFYADQVMLRKIKRAQARPAVEDDDDDDDDAADNTGLSGDSSMQMTQHRKVKPGRDRGRQLDEDIEDDDGEA
ncbi:zinc-finger of the MIZ type in Nse subunit-domain-containing protein [Biscogniauxia marginata]|nr:zinc-finger of the MIZ type in Nse subunit-domain-containing protein [Biscogniauxia marginata]